ncbi:MAG: hypothetical protein CVV17_13240, partial [Gammaproteobacteria bacterium HGW-Gammaproteobacteria-7]
LELPRAERARVESILNLQLRSGLNLVGPLVPLRELVTVSEAPIDQPIYRKNLKPVIYVTGDVAGAAESPAYAIFALNKKLAELDGQLIAGALCLRSSDRLFGRYWGTAMDIPGLHFETCYYQGIEYCLEHGIVAFEPGAQGEHKIARGFRPVSTHSRHWISDPAFAQALASWCTQERAAISRYREQLLTHSPFRNAHTLTTACP